MRYLIKRNNMKFNYKQLIYFGFTATLFFGCGGAADILSTPVENIDTSPLKVMDLTEMEKKNWGHLDLEKDTIPGMAVDRAYTELIKNKKGKKVIVAIIDSGIDIDHEDLDGVIWTNKGEIPNNGKDDDNNGYVDDIHGWNFIGDTYHEQLEYVRLLASGNTSDPRYNEAQALYDSEYKKYTEAKTRNEQIAQIIKDTDNLLANHLKKRDYTIEDVNAIKTENEELLRAKQIAQNVNSNGATLAEATEEINSIIERINNTLNYNLNKNFSGRKTGDNINDLNDRGYGDGNVKPREKTEDHGTHVAGIVGAERNNGKGANGVANNVEIMAIRSTPRGDEYDKDVALGIRYAVDNGAKVINTSFGKGYSPKKEWVYDAIRYAEKNDVLIVNAAGNDAKDIDVNVTYPNDAPDMKNEISDNFLTVGAMSANYNEKLPASFTNYGKINVDVFAPGVQIYSTTPESEYAYKSGTSMAAPSTAGVAALIRSYYPKLSASQVKHILMNSGTKIDLEVIRPGSTSR